MQNNATYELQPIIDQVKFLGNVILEEDLSEQRILEVAQLVLDKVGNKHNDLFVYKGVVDDKGRFDLPCNVEIIEAVGTQIPHSTFESVFAPLSSRQRVFDKAIYRVRDRHESYFKGDFVNYTYKGDHLLISQEYTSKLNNQPHVYSNKDIVVMYYGRIVDDLGRPMVTDREAEAIIYYMMYLKELKMRYKRQGDSGAAAQIALQEANTMIARARVPTYISQNAMQDLKQVVQSRNQWKYNRHNRKHH
jgi:hypothetical protein